MASESNKKHWFCIEKEWDHLKGCVEARRNQTPAVTTRNCGRTSESIEYLKGGVGWGVGLAHWEREIEGNRAFCLVLKPREFLK